MEKTREKELQDLVRRARQSPDKTGSLCRDALVKLIEVTRSDNAALKMLAASNIRCFFTDFPDLEELAINAVYDICEDQYPKVRIEGYNAITLVSKAAPKWIKRNVDVLLQLLQSDEPSEVTVVQKALREHIDLDSRATLEVLCTEINSSAMEGVIEQDEVKKRLCSLVLAFIAGDGKRTITRRIGNNPEARAVLLDGLIAATLKLDIEGVQTIVQDIIVPIFGSDPIPPDKGSALLNTIAENTKPLLQSDLKASNGLKTSKPYLQLADKLVVEKVSPPTHLLQLYCSVLAPKRTLEKLDPNTLAWVLLHLARCLNVSNSEDKTFTVLLDATPMFFERIASEYNKMIAASQVEVHDAVRLLLTCLLRRKDDTRWEVSPQIKSAALLVGGILQKHNTGAARGDANQNLSNGKQQDIQTMIKSLTGVNAKYSENGQSSKLSAAALNEVLNPNRTPSTSTATPPRRIMSIPGKSRSSLPDKPLINGSSSDVTSQAGNKHKIDSEPLSRAGKRPRHEDGSGSLMKHDTQNTSRPSLLSRINSDGAVESASSNSGRNGAAVVNRKRDVQPSSKAVTVGLSIKGAAKMERKTEDEDMEPRSFKETLLGRLALSDKSYDDGTLVNDESNPFGNRRKKKRRA